MLPFDFSNVKLNWFPGHMSTGLKQIRSRIQSEIDLIIEVRDARIPQSSANSLLNTTFTHKPRIIVYSKSDLGESVENKKLLVSKNKSGNDNVCSLLYCKNNKNDLINLLETVKRHIPTTNPHLKHRVMVLGIPNVGKSTIINSLRVTGTGLGGKAVKVGNLAGVTRALSELICISRSPLIYLIDTPGILAPKISNVEAGLKVALCGGLYDKTVGNRLMAEYLLYNLLIRKNREFVEFYGLLEEEGENLINLTIDKFLPIAAKRIGALVSGGEFDVDRAAGFFVRQFRSGKFGGITLDSI